MSCELMLDFSAVAASKALVNSLMLAQVDLAHRNQFGPVSSARDAEVQLRRHQVILA